MITAKKHNVLVYLTPDHGPKHGDQVYLAAAAATVRAGRSLLLLAPEISRVEALAGWLQNQMTSCPVISLHSELTSSILAQRWLALRAASPPVIVVGSRLALFAPLPSPGLIVVDEEADPLYKQEERPRLHARDLAIRRGEQSNIPVLLSARAPSVETYWQCCAGRYHWLTPGPGAGPEPEIDGPGPDPRSINAPPLISTGRLVVIDLRTEPLSDGLLTKPLIDALAARVARGEQSLLFVNRRGYAHSLICRDCGELVRCADCRIGLTYYESAGADGSHLRCRRCGVRLSPPTLCPHCQGHRLGPLGTGTQRVENAVRRRWPDARIVRVDRDVAVQSGREIGSGASDALAAADVLIGTQRCLHAPPPPRLSLVAVLDAELDLSHPDFRAEERQLQLLIRLQGLLQPAIDSSIALVQSRQPDRPILQALTTGRLEAFYTEEIAQRRSLGYPPFRRLAALLLRGRPVANRAIVDQLASAIREQLAAQQGEAVELWGPIPAPPTSHTSMTRHGNTAAWELLLKAETASGLHRSLQAVTRLPLAVRLREAHAMEIEVDPA